MSVRDLTGKSGEPGYSKQGIKYHKTRIPRKRPCATRSGRSYLIRMRAVGRNKICNEVGALTNTDPKTIKHVLEIILSTIKAHVSVGEEVIIPNFGNFTIGYHPPIKQRCVLQEGHNAKKGGIRKSSTFPVFRSARSFKSLCKKEKLTQRMEDFGFKDVCYPVVKKKQEDIAIRRANTERREKNRELADEKISFENRAMALQDYREKHPDMIKKWESKTCEQK